MLAVSVHDGQTESEQALDGSQRVGDPTMLNALHWVSQGSCEPWLEMNSDRDLAVRGQKADV